MTQEQYIMIKKVLFSGCPACAKELCSALDNLIEGYKALAKELDTLRKPNNDENKKEDK